MNRLILAGLALLGLLGFVGAQTTQNPAPVANSGAYNSAPPTCTAGQFCYLQTDAAGNLKTTVSGTGPASGAAASGIMPVAPMIYNGSTYDPAYTCTNSVALNQGAGSTLLLVTGAANTIARICSVVITASVAATTATFVRGTGAGCATGQVAMSGALRMNDGSSFVFVAPPGVVAHAAPVGESICLTSATGGLTGWYTWARY